MAYLVTTASSTSLTSGPGFNVGLIVSGYVANDLLLCCVVQDVGGTAISATGWTSLGTQSDSGGRMVWLYKIAASSSETLGMISGGNHNWFIEQFVIRDVDTTTPFDGSAKSDWATPSSRIVANPSLSTSYDNDLLIYACDTSGTNFLTFYPSDLIQINKYGGSGTAISMGVVFGQRNQITHGAVPTCNMLHEVATTSGQYWVLAIKNKSGGKPDINANPVFTPIRWHGLWEPPSISAPNSVSGLTSINGVNMGTTTGTATTVTLVPVPWGLGTSQQNTENTAGAWCGYFDTFTSTYNLSNQMVAISYRFLTATQLGSQGLALVFVDSSNNWAAYQIQSKTSLNTANTYTTHIAVGVGTPFASGGTINWGLIKKVGYLHHRIGSSASSSSITWRPLIATNGLILTWGNSAKPLKTTVLDNVFNGWGDVQLAASANGNGQGLNRQSVQFGDGTTPTYVDFTACSYELPLGTDAQWMGGVNCAPFTVYAGASDTYRFLACVIATATRQTLTIHASSSTSASMTWAGASIIGWDVVGKSGMPAFNNVSFSGCYSITLNGQGLASCIVTGNTLSTTACTTTDLGTITGTSFTSAGTGHAITITTPGTYTFSGNTFTGYASSNGSTGNEAIYNNSGGAVTINITGGGTTPTIRNGTSATTTLNRPVTLTLTGLVSGSDIVILATGTTTEKVNVDANSGTTYAFLYSYVAGTYVDICCYKSGYVAFSVRNYLLSASDTSLPIAQIVDRAYA